jgi:hypothetical protein
MTTQKAADTSQNPRSGSFAFDMNVTVIRIPHKPVTPTLQLTIQIIKHQIRQ